MDGMGLFAYTFHTPCYEAVTFRYWGRKCLWNMSIWILFIKLRETASSKNIEKKTKKTYENNIAPGNLWNLESFGYWDFFGQLWMISQPEDRLLAAPQCPAAVAAVAPAVAPVAPALAPWTLPEVGFPRCFVGSSRWNLYMTCQGCQVPQILGWVDVCDVNLLSGETLKWGKKHVVLGPFEKAGWVNGITWTVHTKY